MSVEQIAGKGFKFDWDFPIESLPNGNFGVGAVCVVEGRQFITTQYQHASKAMCLLTAIMKVVELELTGWVELKLLANNGNHHRVAAKKVSKVEGRRSATSVHGFVIGYFY